MIRLRSLPLAAALAAPALAQIPNPVLEALPDGAWSRLADTAMEEAGSMEIPCCTWGLGCDLPGIFAFSGATLDTHRHQVLVWGGGHNDYFGNQLLAFELATLDWRKLTEPTSVCLFSSPPSYRFTDGTPVARHTYDHFDYIPDRGVLFAFSGSAADAPPFNSGNSYADVWTYDLVVGGWTDHTPLVGGDTDWGLGQPGASGEYDPVTKKWFQTTQYGVWSFDFTTLLWSYVNDDGPPGIERSSVLDPVRRRIWSYGGGYGGDANLTAYAIDTNQFELVESGAPPGNREAAGLAYDAANDDLVLYGGSGSGSVWNYDLGSGTWTEFVRPGAPVTDQVYGRFLYDPAHNLFLLVADVDGVWVWKNTLGSSLAVFRDGFESGDTSAWSSAMP